MMNTNAPYANNYNQQQHQPANGQAAGQQQQSYGYPYQQQMGASYPQQNMYSQQQNQQQTVQQSQQKGYQATANAPSASYAGYQQGGKSITSPYGMYQYMPANQQGSAAMSSTTPSSFVNNSAPKANQPTPYLSQSYSIYPYAQLNGYTNGTGTIRPYFAPSNFKLAQSKPSSSKPFTGRYFNSTAKRGKFAGQSSTPGQVFYCDVCTVNCSNAEALKAHLSGKSHQKAVQVAEKIKANAGQPATNGNFACAICQCMCSDAEALRNHLEGKSHKQKIVALRKNNKPVPQVTVPPPSEPKPKNDNATGAKPKAVDNMAEKEVIGRDYVRYDPSKIKTNELYWCMLCNTGFSAEVTAVSHMKGRRHKFAYKAKVDKNYQPDVSADDSNRSRNKSINSSSMMSNRSRKSLNGSMSLNLSRSLNRSIPSSKNLSLNSPPSFFKQSNFAQQITAFDDYEAQIILTHDEITSVEQGFMVVRNCLINFKEQLTSSSNLRIEAFVPYGNFSEKAFISMDSTVEVVLLVNKVPSDEEVKNFFSSFVEFLNKTDTTKDATLAIDSLNPEEYCLTVKSKPAMKYDVGYKISILPTSYYSAKGSPQEWENLTDRKFLAIRQSVKQSQWAEKIICTSNVACQTLRVLRSLISETPELNSLGEWRLKVLIDTAAQSLFSELSFIHSAPQINPVGLLRYFFDMIGSGIALPGDLNPRIADPLVDAASDEESNIFSGMKPDDLVALTEMCQKMLNLITLNKLNKVLVVE